VACRQRFRVAELHVFGRNHSSPFGARAEEPGALADYARVWKVLPGMNKPLGGAERPLFVSDSLLDQQLKLPSQAGAAPDQNLTRRAYAPGPQDQRLRVVELEIGPAGAQSSSYSYAVAGDAAEIDRDLAEFRMMLIAALGVLERHHRRRWCSQGAEARARPHL